MHVFDTSVLVAALVESERRHEECLTLLRSGPFAVWSHGLVETFHTLTGGKIKPRPTASQAASVLERSVRQHAAILHLTDPELFAAINASEGRGVRGGAIFDYLHLMAARAHGAERLYTLDRGHFLSFCREGDPEIAEP